MGTPTLDERSWAPPHDHPTPRSPGRNGAPRADTAPPLPAPSAPGRPRTWRPVCYAPSRVASQLRRMTPNYPGLVCTN